MKIKTDFVTNSSSSSFVVMGTSINSDIITEEHVKKFSEQLNTNFTLDYIKDNFSDFLDSLLYKSDLKYSTGGDYYGSEAMIGIHYTDMKDDETLGEFKTRVKNQIKETLDIDVKKVDHIEMSWEDR